MGTTAPNQLFRQGYLLRSIDRYQPWVCLTSPPYLVTLLHSTAHHSEVECPLKTGDWTRGEEMKTESKNKADVLSLYLALIWAAISSSLWLMAWDGAISSEWVGARMCMCLRSGVLGAECVTEVTSNVNGMFSYKLPNCVCVCVCLHLCKISSQRFTVYSSTCGAKHHKRSKDKQAHCDVCFKSSDGQ